VRSVVQRVERAAVRVGADVVAAIDQGLLVLVGVARGDGPADVDYTASKILGLRVFGDEQGRMNRSLVDTGGAVLVVSQFTLLGDVRRGRRPSFDEAAEPTVARELYKALVTRLREAGPTVEAGRFQAHMHVELVNDGPVTLLIDSRRVF
jgi:D-tyrosyl-tRNA(Tyr) deacylase